MLAILIVSIAIRLAALIGLLLLLRRRTTRGTLALTVVVGLLVLRQLLTLATDGGGSHLDELPDLAVSCVLLGVVVLIARHGSPRLMRGLDQPHQQALSEIALNRNVVAVLDADGTIRYLNSPAAQVMGYRPAELLGRTPFEFIHEADH
ncbi:MAG: PAS domain-containing protein, partial [Gemmatimonadales bacterium]